MHRRVNKTFAQINFLKLVDSVERKHSTIIEIYDKRNDKTVAFLISPKEFNKLKR